MNNKIDAGGNCDESSWHDVDDVCGECKVIAHEMDDIYITCSGYCAVQGLQCKAAWEDTEDTCTEKREEDCDYDFGDETNDAICECMPRGGMFICCCKMIS